MLGPLGLNRALGVAPQQRSRIGPAASFVEQCVRLEEALQGSADSGLIKNAWAHFLCVLELVEGEIYKV